MNSLFLALFLVFPQTWFSPEVLSGNSLATLDNPISLFYNPSLLPLRRSFFISYSNPFGIKDLMTGRLAFAEKGMAFGVSTLKSTEYLEGSFAVGFRKKFGKGKIGVTLRGLFLEIGGSPMGKDIAIDMAFHLPYERFAIGGSLRNLNTPSMAGSILSPSVDLTTKVSVLRGVDFFFDLFHESFHPISLRVGQTWKLHHLLAVFWGASSYPPIISFGFTVGERPYLSFSLKEHPELGETKSISVGW